MSRTHRPTLMVLIAMLALFVLGTSAQFRETYCSKDNTASNSVSDSWDYQSNGNCTTHCAQEGSFAFAVIQYKDCYCSDFIPSSQVSMSQCQKSCPGFPTEHCGSFEDDLYMYLKLSGQPSGTAGAGGKPVQATSSAIVSSSPSPPPSSPSTRAPSPSQASQRPTEPQTSVQVVTESGAVITRTVVQTPSPTPNSSSSSVPVRTGNGGSGTNVGAIAGGVAGGIVGLLAIVGVIFVVLWKRKKHQREAEEGAAGNVSGAAGITRNTSTMSKAGLLGGGAEPYPPVASNYGSQYSRYGADAQSTSPMSNRRNSQPLIVDSRMNPETYIEHAHANASRESVGTIDDSRDYARKLGVRNPDP
ncbi:hypothetical protein CC86DRAFT_307180 [Ophiobolus disseminans]|uniref:WSC domain-containing protein n=1 Tax=Ophiobolus disseminans TaxID=1469910 RepID=A0A6A6ZE97_9PLEO|nr:hypothetical protein CC86DRAFT_307180 [Ophiobolus disseminans]